MSVCMRARASGGCACRGFEHHHQGLFPSARDVRTEISGSARTRSPTCQAAAPDPNKVEMVMSLFMCKQRRAVGFFNDCMCRQNATAWIDVRSA